MTRRKPRPPTPMQRHRAAVRLYRVAQRHGKLDAAGQLGELTANAMRQARTLAIDIGVIDIDIEAAIMAGTMAGRAGVRVPLLAALDWPGVYLDDNDNDPKS